jgi:hypothetical protein
MKQFEELQNSQVKVSMSAGHRDKTRVQMPAKIFPHLKLKC